MSVEQETDAKQVQEKALKKLNDRIYNANYAFEFLISNILKRLPMLSNNGNSLNNMIIVFHQYFIIIFR